MSITTSTRRMTAKEEMIYDLGAKYERDRCERKVSSLLVKPNDPDFQGTDEEETAYNTAINNALDLIRTDIELSKGDDL